MLSSVRIVTRLWVDDQHSIPSRVTDFFLFTTASRQVLGAHSASNPVGTWGSFPEVKWPGHDADHSPPSNAEVKITWCHTSMPHTSSWLGA